MAGAAVVEDPKYWAFISYSHKDASFGRRLHRRLETYALPRRLAGHTTPQGVVPARLAPIFRDREELPAAHDLSTEVQAALKESRSLIVVCSPDAAGSRWVSREVELYRALHPDRPILAAIRSGEPGECFPTSLIHSTPDGKPIEPLAADFRRGRDGEHLGLLKLVAGVAGLGLDELAQRDAQRHRQRVTAVTAASLAAVLGMGALTAFALKARYEAEHQRSEAEGLVEFMLTDLRDRLKGVGRLDVMTAVNERALHYYTDQDLNALPVDSLERRARILHAWGEDDEARGNHTAALTKFREAERTTAELLSQAPDDPERIFDHAQSEYWIGYEYYQRSLPLVAKQHFVTYVRLADRMVALAPEKTKYHIEVSYAESNLCTVLLWSFRKPKEAMRHCLAALRQAQDASQHLHSDVSKKEIVSDLMNCLGNIANVYRAMHDTERARIARRKEEALLDHEFMSDPRNMDLQDTWVAQQIAFAELYKDEGKIDAARNILVSALHSADKLHHFDLSNARSMRQRGFIERELKQLGS